MVNSSVYCIRIYCFSVLLLQRGFWAYLQITIYCIRQHRMERSFVWNTTHCIPGLAYTMSLLETGIIFLCLQVIAEITILNEYLMLLNDKIKTDPKFFTKIIKKHCSVIENINLLNDIISETSSLQFVFIFTTLLMGFTFVLKYKMGIVNYFIILCGAVLGLPICILGEFIKIKTENLSNTFYQTYWYELSLKDQKIFLIILGMAQREYGIKAARMYEIKLYIFVQVR
uniref:Odorant receptor n=1 Tax=Lutzomyia longipalpis TaxID=7200 RepID=A0A7G3B8D4_LUTLO